MTGVERDQLAHSAACIATCRRHELRAVYRGDWTAADTWIANAHEYQRTANVFSNSNPRAHGAQEGEPPCPITPLP